MHRTVVNVQTGEVTQVELTAEEIAVAEAQYQAWLAAGNTPLPAEEPTQE
jgi:hypothetical protein